MITIVGLLLVLVLAPHGVAAAQQDDTEEMPILFGMSGGDWRSYLPAFTSATGRGSAFVGLFWTFDDYSWPNAWAAAGLDEVISLGAVPFIEITTQEFDAFADHGSPSLAAMVETVATWASESPANRLLIAPFPEANLPEHPWGGDRAAFLEAYERVVDAFRDASLGPDQVRFVLALNGGIAAPLTYQDYYPGDDRVDIVGFSKLNRNDPWRDYEEAFGRHIAEIQDELTTTKPIIAFQTGSVEEGGDRAAWLRDMFQGLASEDQVLGAIYFNVDKFEGGKQNDYRIVEGGQVDPVAVQEYPGWSPPSDVDWIFDGRLDAWETERLEELQEAGGFIDTLDSVFAHDIAWLASEGITQGCNPPANDRFCPDEFVTRGQMAAFLVRAMGHSGGGDGFVDDDGSVFEADIEKLAAAGVTLGCNPPDNDRFCPDELVTRGQMAAFLNRAVGG